VKILVIVTGTGEPKFSQKIFYIKRNFELLERTKPIGSTIDFEVIHYDDSIVNESIDNVKKTYNQGLVGQHIYNCVKPEKLKLYDHALVMLDDIELCENFILSEMIDLQLKYKIDILSPSLTCDSIINQGNMRTCVHIKDQGKMIVQNHLEYFCYLFCMSDENLKNSFNKWYSLFDENTKYMWGIDFALTSCLGLKCVMHNDVHIKHLFKGAHQSGHAYTEWERLNKKLKEKYNKTAVINREFISIIDTNE
jgi:hypothetical protein